MGILTLYHGSSEIVQAPVLSKGKTYSDFVPGFYCTEHMELAKEWACGTGSDGYAAEYELHTDGLNILRIGDDNHAVLSWLYLLTRNRKLAVTSHVVESAISWLADNFSVDFSTADVIIGPRCDDSYFALATAFLRGDISFRTLCSCMDFDRKNFLRVALVSEKAFENLRFVSYEPGDYSVYYPRRMVRDARLRANLKRLAERDEFGALYMRDIIREGVLSNDSRLR